MNPLFIVFLKIARLLEFVTCLCDDVLLFLASWLRITKSFFKSFQSIRKFSVITQAWNLVLSAEFADAFHVIDKGIFLHDRYF